MTEQKLSKHAEKLWMSVLWTWWVIVALLTVPIVLVTWIALVSMELGFLIVFLLAHLYIKAYVSKFRFTYDHQELRVYSGLWWQKRKALPFSRITNITTVQGPWQRKRGLTTLNIETAGKGGQSMPEAQLWSQEQADTLLDDMLSRVQTVNQGNSTDGTSAPDSIADSTPWNRLFTVLDQIEKNTQSK